MKTKFTKILGVVVPLVMVAALAVALVPASSPPAGAAAPALQWEAVTTSPEVAEDGDFWLTPFADIGAWTIAPDASTMFATIGGQAEGLVYEITTQVEGDTAEKDACWAVEVTYLNQDNVTATTTFGVSYPKEVPWWNPGAPAVAVGATGGIGLAANDSGVLAITDVTGAKGYTKPGSPKSCKHADATVGALSIKSGGFNAITMATFTDNATNSITGNFVAGANCTAWETLVKSTDGGYTWEELDGLADEMADQPDTTNIVDVVVSPEYATDTTMYVATENLTYRSLDGGKTFSAMAKIWGDAPTENITDMDVALDDGGRLALVVGTTAANNAGEIYVNCPATTGGDWVEQLIGASNNVLAVAFSPDFTSDEGLVAVVVAESASANWTKMTLAFGSTADGGGWGQSVGDATFDHKADGDDLVIATRASFAFPDDFNVDSLTQNVAFVALSGVKYYDSDAATPDLVSPEGGVGDVFKVTFRSGTDSVADDLNVRGTYAAGSKWTASDVYSVGVSGDADSAFVLAGLNSWNSGESPVRKWLTYYSSDSGDTWSSARVMQATGGNPYWGDLEFATAPTKEAYVLAAGTNAACRVLLSPNYATDGAAYAATKGLLTSGLNRSTNGGKTWEQIGLVDHGNTVTGYSAEEYAAGKGIETDDGGVKSIWSMSDGVHFVRTFSNVNPTMTKGVKKGPKGVKGGDPNYVFISDKGIGKLWRSSDAGLTFPRTVWCKYPGVKLADKVKIIDEKTLECLYSGGTTGLELWHTESLGRPWVQRDLEGMTGSLIGDPGSPRTDITDDVFFLVNTAGGTYLTTDAGETFSRVGKTDAFDGDRTRGVTVAESYAETHFIYSGLNDGSEHIQRLELVEDDPDSTDWEAIRIRGLAWNDNLATALFQVFDANVKSMKSGKGGVWNADQVETLDGSGNTTGGIWRSVNFDAPTAGLYPPEFQFVGGTEFGMKLGEYLGKKGARSTVSIDAVDAVPYYAAMLEFNDTLQVPATPVAPADGAEAGISLSTFQLTWTVPLSWEALTGAEEYGVQVSLKDDFTNLVAEQDGITSQQVLMGTGEAGSGILIPGNTYYWRVRSEMPLWSPWSETRSFNVATVGMGEPPAPAKPKEKVPTVAEEVVAAFAPSNMGPTPGTTSISVTPTFTWPAYPGAIGYEIMLSENPDFAILEWSRSTDNTFFVCEDPLAYSTTYYWRVRAVLGEAVPAEAKVKAPPEEEAAPAEEPPAGEKKGKKGGGGGGPGKKGPPAPVIPTGPWITSVFTTEARPEVEPAVVAPPAVPEIEIVEVPTAPSIPTALLWAIVAIGAVLVIALIVLIVRTRRVT